MPLHIILFSFGYKHAHPDADAVIDVRFLPNPYWVPELSLGTGLDAKVAEYVLDNSVAESFLLHLEPFLLNYFQGFSAAGQETFRLAVGCTGGRHRSVAVVEVIRKILDKHGIALELFHRDIDKV